MPSDTTKPHAIRFAMIFGRIYAVIVISTIAIFPINQFMVFFLMLLDSKIVKIMKVLPMEPNIEPETKTIISTIFMLSWQTSKPSLLYRDIIMLTNLKVILIMNYYYLYFPHKNIN